MKGPFSAVIIYIALQINLCAAGYDASYLRPNAMEENVQIPCHTDKECEEMEFLGFKCVNSICTCQDKSKCHKADLKPLVTKVGQNCTKDSQCNVSQSFCNNGTCECLENTVRSKNKRRCLNVGTKIGMRCEEDVQCLMLNGLCMENECKCPPHMHAEKGICFNSTDLGSSCEKNEDCSNIDFSKCKNGVCVCEKKYVKSATNTSQCLLKARDLLSTCSEDIQCSSAMGPASVCSNGLCICTNSHHFKANANKCVRDVLLGEVCGNHTDCHQPGSEENRLECVEKECKCKYPYYETEGYCMSSVTDSGMSWSSLRFLDVLPFVLSYVLFYVII